MNAAKKYLTNHPELKHYDACVVRAFEAPGHVVKVQSGLYLVVIDCDLVQIERRDDADSMLGWWDIREPLGKWYNDTMPTLRSAKECLGIES